MAEYEDKVLHDIDGIKEYDNPLPGWLMAIWWGAIAFAVLYLAFYALRFGERSMDSEYRAETEKALASVQAYFDANPLVPPTSAELLAGAADPAVIDRGAGRFAKSCASCHGEKAQGLIGPGSVIMEPTSGNQGIGLLDVGKLTTTTTTRTGETATWTPPCQNQMARLNDAQAAPNGHLATLPERTSGPAQEKAS